MRMCNNEQYNAKSSPSSLTEGFVFVRNGVPEPVTLEKWGWAVVYSDGSELHQFDSDGKFHQFNEINQSEVNMFVMYDTSDLSKRYDLILSGDVQIFHFYRHFVLKNDTRREKVYGFGWKDRETGITSYNFIMPNGRLISSNSDIEDLTVYNL